MKLAAWMKENGWSDQKLADALGLKERLTVLYWRKGKSIPQPRTMRRIINLTGGAVGPADFYEPAQ